MYINIFYIVENYVSNVDCFLSALGCLCVVTIKYEHFSILKILSKFFYCHKVDSLTVSLLNIYFKSFIFQQNNVCFLYIKV